MREYIMKENGKWMNVGVKIIKKMGMPEQIQERKWKSVGINRKENVKQINIRRKMYVLETWNNRRKKMDNCGI